MFAQRKRNWMTLLERAGRSIAPRDERDAEAMARLELCNERLRAAGRKERLLYITGDSLLIEAASYYLWEDEGRGDFATAYLRHPRAYLDEPEVMRPLDREAEVGGETLFGWLTVLLGRIDELAPNLRLRGGTIQFPERIKVIIAEVAADDPQAAGKILDRWRNFALAVSDVPLAPKSHVHRLAQLLTNPDAAELLDKARDDAEQEIAATWTKVFYVSAGARLALEAMMPTGTYGGPPEREVPRLVFENRPKLAGFLRRGGLWLDQNQRFDHQRYDQMRKQVRNEDTTEYGDYIGHAYLLAQQAQWKTAGILAGIASSRVNVAVRFRPEQSNGRESHYLEAYCARLTSMRLQDLARPRALILEAIRIQKEEAASARAEGLAHEAATERFEAELIILDASEALYRWLDDQSLVALQHSLKSVRSALLSLATKTAGRLTSFETLRGCVRTGA